METKNLLRRLPQIAKVVEYFKEKYPEEYIKVAAKEVISQYRQEIKNRQINSIDNLYSDIEQRINELLLPSLRRVINATGVIIHTNLGRSPISKEVLEFLTNVAFCYSNLEYDLKSGKRSSRQKHVEEYLKKLTGAEDAFAVNNNAGAVYLILNTLSFGKEVIISRGELVEIGGSFRIPDIMEKSGAILKEVGTTNKTKLSDYEKAISENTALLMKVHRSNFFMDGFVSDVSLEELVDISKKYGIPLYYDAGSGLIMNLSEFGIKNTKEPSFEECIKLGVNIVSGSGDKLLGGPQAGIILGEGRFIKEIKKNPISRALRIDKLTLSALEITLRLYVEKRYREIPVIRMLSENEENLKRKAQKIKRGLQKIKDISVKIIKDISKPGGGSLPDLELPTYCVAIKTKKITSEHLAQMLRNSSPPIISRIKGEILLLDVRTIFNEDIKSIIDVFRNIFSEQSKFKS